MSYSVLTETKVPLNTGLPINPEMRGGMSSPPTGILPLISGWCILQKLGVLQALGGREDFSQVTTDP